jgi:hypothetical protein
MRVLVMESDRHAAEGAIAQLRAANHEVFRCHERGAAAFPCNALADASGCPLDTPGGIDVALTVRAHPHPRPSAFEDGVSCALRRHVPLVVAGTSALSPFDEWTTVIADGLGVVDACETAARLPIESLSRRGREAAETLLSTLGRDPAGTAVTVRRRDGRLVADVELPTGCADLHAAAATHVLGAVRADEPSASGIDVLVTGH